MPDSFAEAVERRVKGFDPEGAGYDEETADELREAAPLPEASKPKREGGVDETVVYTDPDTKKVSFEAWVWHPEKKDWLRHGSSRDPRTGMLLKGRKHETWDKLEKGEVNAGFTLYKDPESGRYFSTDGSYLRGTEK